MTYWHRPIIVQNMQTRLGDVIGRMTVAPQRPDDDVIHHDMILVWGAQRRIITGSDLLGRLLREIATVENPVAAVQPVASETGSTTAVPRRGRRHRSSALRCLARVVGLLALPLLHQCIEIGIAFLGQHDPHRGEEDRRGRPWQESPCP